MRDQLRDVVPGAVHLPRRLSAGEQHAVADLCLRLGRDEAGFYRPVARGGHPMSVQMLCLGRHWNALRYQYEAVRSDVDQRPVPALPDELRVLAQTIGEEAGFTFQPDVCIVNLYGDGSRMGLHRDQDETAESLARGAPVVSLSIGDTARFLFGGLRRRDPVDVVWLESGDAFVFGGPARLRYHGVTRILPGSGPADIGVAGRLNLTFREY